MKGHHLSARRDDGQALVEFALVLPLLLIVMFGCLEFGRLLNYWLNQNRLANELARSASVDRYPSVNDAYLTARGTPSELVNGSSSVDKVKVKVCYPDGTSNVGDRVRVRVDSTFHLLPILGVLNPNVPIAGQADMRVEVKPSSGATTC